MKLLLNKRLFDKPDIILEVFQKNGETLDEVYGTSKVDKTFLVV